MKWNEMKHVWRLHNVLPWVFGNSWCGRTVGKTAFINIVRPGSMKSFSVKWSAHIRYVIYRWIAGFSRSSLLAYFSQPFDLWHMSCFISMTHYHNQPTHFENVNASLQFTHFGATGVITTITLFDRGELMHPKQEHDNFTHRSNCNVLVVTLCTVTKQPW